MGYDNPYNGQNPIMGPLLRAYQMYSMVQGLKNDQLNMQMRQEQMQHERSQDATQNAFRERAFSAQEDERGYDRKQSDLKTRLHLGEVGAKLGNPEIEKMLTGLHGAPKDPRAAATTPTGETYYLPTESERRTKSLKDILDKGRLETAVDIEKMQALFPFKVGEIEARQKFEQQYNTNKPTAPRFVQTETAGMGIDPMTGKPVWSNPNLKKTPAAADKSISQTALLNKKEQFEQMKTKAEQLFLEADALEASGDTEKKSQAQFQRRAAYNQLKLAKAFARQIKISHPEAEVGGIGDDDQAPYVK